MIFRLATIVCVVFSIPSFAYETTATGDPGLQGNEAYEAELARDQRARERVVNKEIEAVKHEQLMEKFDGLKYHLDSQETNDMDERDVFDIMEGDSVPGGG